MLYHRFFLIMFKKMLCKLVKHKSMFRKILDKPNKVLCKLTEHKKTLKRHYVNYWRLSNKSKITKKKKIPLLRSHDYFFKVSKKTLDKLKKEDNAGYWDYLFSPITNFPKENKKEK